MKTTIRILAALACIAPAGLAFAQGCPQHELPSTPSDDGTPNNNTCDNGSPIPDAQGDPVDLIYGNTIDRRTELKVKGTAQDLLINHLYTSDEYDWDLSQSATSRAGDIKQIHGLFGRSWKNQDSIQWSINVYSFVVIDADPVRPRTTVYDRNGHPTDFGPLCSTSGEWCPMPNGGNDPHNRDRLYWNGTEFLLKKPDGKSRIFAEHIVGVPPAFDADASRDYYFLKSEYNSSGARVLDITYGSNVTAAGWHMGAPADDMACPTNMAYPTTVIDGQGHTLHFEYEYLEYSHDGWTNHAICLPDQGPITAGGTANGLTSCLNICEYSGTAQGECVLSEIDQRSWTPGGGYKDGSVIAYDYAITTPSTCADAGNAPSPGLLSKITTPTDTYNYEYPSDPDPHFRVYDNDVLVSDHTYGSGTQVSAQDDLKGHYEYNFTPGNHTATTTTARPGDNSASAASLVRASNAIDEINHVNVITN